MHEVAPYSPIRARGTQFRPVNTDPPSFLHLNLAAKLKVAGIFVLGAGSLVAGGLVVAGSIVFTGGIGVWASAPFFTAGIMLFIIGKQMLSREKAQVQLNNFKVNVARQNLAEEIRQNKEYAEQIKFQKDSELLIATNQRYAHEIERLQAELAQLKQERDALHRQVLAASTKKATGIRSLFGF